MLNELFDNLKTFITSDVKDKNETKELAVLIRITCIILSIYYLIMGICVAALQHYYIGLILVGTISVLVISFILTYENHTKLGLVVLILTIIAISTLLAFKLGYDMGYHILIFLPVLLIYFNKTDNMILKHIFALFVCAYQMCLTQFCEAFGISRIPAGFSRIFIQSTNMAVMAIVLGCIAYSYCNKFNDAEEKLRKINENLEKMANLDTLTGLSNRRHMNEHMQVLVFDFNKSGKTFTLAIGDVDFFKRVNDTYGHDTGDYVLSTVANQFKTFMKDKGHVSRWGGEEFLFAFENANIDKAAKYMEELRKIIEAYPMHFKEFDFHITMTFGVEEFNERLGVEATINRADNKLYKGKTGGRNRVVI